MLWYAGLGERVVYFGEGVLGMFEGFESVRIETEGAMAPGAPRGG